jgi:hypothetical protein
MDTIQSQIILSIVKLADFLSIVVFNGLATTPPVNNKTTGELLDQYPNLFVPDCDMMPYYSQVSK